MNWIVVMTLDVAIYLALPAFEERNLDVGNTVTYMRSTGWLCVSSTFILIETLVYHFSLVPVMHS